MPSLYSGSYNNLVWGPGTPFQVDTAKGFEDLPNLRRRLTPKSAEDGQFHGRYLMDFRQPTLVLHIRPDLDPQKRSLDALCKVLVQATPRVLTGSVPLYFDNATRIMFCRIWNRTITRDKSGQYGQATLAWEAMDVRIYEDPVRTAVLRLPQLITAGAQVPLWVSMPIVAGPYGQVDALNYGNETSFPVFTIQGPVTNPWLVNSSTGLILKWAITLGPNDTLLVDTQARTTLLNSVAPRNEITGSDWWNLQAGDGLGNPGHNVLQFRADTADPAASCVITWRSAWA